MRNRHRLYTKIIRGENQRVATTRILLFILQNYIVCLFAASLEKKVRELYAAVCRLEEEKYDWEARLGRQTEEVATCALYQRNSV